MNDDVYASCDLVEITYLMCKGVEIESVQRQTRTSERVFFFFRDQDRCQKLLLDLGCGKDLVSITSAMATIKRARAMMHAAC